MKRIAACVVFVLLVLALPPLAFSQTDQAESFPLESLLNKQVIVQTQDRREFLGQLVDVHEDRIELADAGGVVVQIMRERVKSIQEIKQRRLASLQLQDASASRLIMAPTAFPMEPGTLLISNIELVGVTASYGLTRNLSLWSGATFTGTAVNVRLSSELADGLVGISLGSFIGVNWFGSLTDLIIPYASASIGSAKANLTGGIGGAMTMDTHLPLGIDLNAFVVMAGGRLPLFRSTALIFENWLILPYDPFFGTITQSMTVITAAVIRFPSTRLSWDIGLALPFTVDPDGIQGLFGWFSSVFPVPILSVTYRIK